MPGSNELAMTRTRLAYDRTLMAWIRTGFSMISFGFTIVKFFEYLGQNRSTGGAAVPDTEPRHLGVALILLGTFSLAGATIQYLMFIRRQRRQGLHTGPSLVLAVALLLTVLGLGAVFQAAFRRGFL